MKQMLYNGFLEVGKLPLRLLCQFLWQQMTLKFKLKNSISCAENGKKSLAFIQGTFWFDFLKDFHI